MKQCKALLKKEWQTHWKSLMAPLLFVILIYVTVLVSYLIVLIKRSDPAPHPMLVLQGIGLQAPYWVTMSVTIALAFLHAMSGIVLAESMLNSDHKQRCQIFHFSQPAFFLKIVGVKYLFSNFGPILLFGVVSLVHALVLSLWSGLYSIPSFALGMTGWLQSFISASLSILFLSSMAWFFSGLFKRKSILLGFLCLLGIEIVRQTINYMVGLQIPSLMEGLSMMVDLNVNNFLLMGKYTSSSLASLVRANWRDIFSTTSALKIGLSAVFGILGAVLYKRRELQ